MARFTLRSLLGLARQDGGTVAEVAPSHDAAGVELTAARQAVTDAERAYQDALLTATDDALRSLDSVRRDAAMRLDRAEALMAAFHTKMTNAQAAERQAELEGVIAEADRAQAVFEELARNDLPAIAIAVRSLIRAEAEAQIARDVANTAISAASAGEPRSPVGAFRGTGGRPARTLRREEFEGWCDPNGDLSGYDDQIIRQQDGSGFLHLANAVHSKRFTRRRRFERQEVLAAEPVRIPAALAETISIPGLRAGDAPIWAPMKDQAPTRVLAELNRIERHRDPEGDTRQPSVAVRAIGPVTEVAKPARVPNLRAS